MKTRQEIEAQLETMERTAAVLTEDKFVAGHVDALKWVLGEVITPADIQLLDGE